MAGILIAILSGILMSVQGVFNTDVTEHSSLWVANTWVQMTALAVCFAFWGMADRSSFALLFDFRPKYVLLGGVIGAFITLTVVKSMDIMGPAQAVLFIVIAQMISAYLIELAGWFGMEKADWSVQKLIGMAVAIGGVILFQWERNP
ncbi:MAG: DMT family transporter [Lachnospiraceae bacterium]|nr:DMT family transporter [Lachnospiraceae bacterium]